MKVKLASSSNFQSNQQWQVVLIAPGVTVDERFYFSDEVLASAIEKFSRVSCFVDHSFNARSVRDLCGFFTDVEHLAGVGIVGKLSALPGSAGDLLAMLADDVISNNLAVGFSLDVWLTTDSEKPANVTHISKIESCDLVINPNAGGKFLRALQSFYGANTMTIETADELRAEAERIKQSAGDILTMKDQHAAQKELEAARAQFATARIEATQTIVEMKLSADDVLPDAAKNRIRKMFAGRTADVGEIAQAITDEREYLQSVADTAVVVGVPGGARVGGMFTSSDHVEAAAYDLLGVERPAHLSEARPARLTGIRELYLGMTGDTEMLGGYSPKRAQFATTTTMPALVASVLNKSIAQNWANFMSAGYDWWKTVTETIKADSLNDIKGVNVSAVGLLPTVAEGGNYTELTIKDGLETAPFVKKGGYLPFTLEMMDRDDTRAIRAYPKALARSAIRSLSAQVAGIFTANAGAGPTLASDGLALFHATHGNLGTTALSAAEFEAKRVQIYNQSILAAAGQDGGKLAINPEYLLVPRVLQKTALDIVAPAYINATNNTLRGTGTVVVVPEWSDANDWAVITNPLINAPIQVAFRFGEMPEIFVADDERYGSLFSNDEMRLKARFFFAVLVASHIGVGKNNVA